MVPNAKMSQSESGAKAGVLSSGAAYHAASACIGGAGAACGHLAVDIAATLAGGGAGNATKLGKLSEAAKLGELSETARLAKISEAAKVNKLAEASKAGELADAGLAAKLGPALPEKYWKDRKAPTQVQPGTRTVTDIKPSSRGKGDMYERITHYDEYGRSIGQTHTTDHGQPDIHPNPHHHTRNPVSGEQSGPLPGPHPAKD